ncbi:MAG TPA: MerR family transcriptional regulator [Candidatus Dormibacteraeota bacterium]|nr:MerR family transcriptional regulator [Candidatus Dormibacteraeota bacterium]
MLDAKQIAEILQRQDHDLEVSPSTLHYYVQVGILPPAVGRGRSGYTPEHLTRFRLARRLRRKGVALADIRERLRDLSPAAVAAELATGQPDPAPPVYRLAAPAQGVAGEAASPRLDEAAARYTLAAEALRARSGDTPRTLRFRGGFSLQVPAGTGDEQIARLYTAIEAALDHEDGPGAAEPEQEDESR